MYNNNILFQGGNNMKDIIIIGASAHGRIAADTIRSMGGTVRGFIDDAYEKGTVIDGIPVLGDDEDAKGFPDCGFIIAIGNREKRKQISALGLDWTTIIHPSAVVSSSAKIGRGCFVMPLAVINADAVIGDFSIVKSGAVVEYDNRIGNFCNLAPNSVCGASCVIGDNTQISIGATVRNNINICADVTVGAGAVVVRDIKEPGAYVGIPAKKLD